MAHIRQQIREKAVAFLKAGCPTLGNRVWANRMVPIESAETPAVVIFTNSDRPTEEDRTSGGPARQVREVSLLILLCVGFKDSLDSVIDDAAVEIEEAIANNRTFDGLGTASYRGSELQFAEDQPIATLRIEYAVEVEVREDDPESTISDIVATPFR